MKLYTKTGDNGETSLFAGGRVPKYDLRVDAYGTVDELNSFIGLIRSYGVDSQADAWLEIIQNDLFRVGADLATPMDADAEWVIRLTADEVEPLEAAIDQMTAELEPLKVFILPGGTPAAATAHVARTVCRRAERLVVEAGTKETINTLVIVYLNRLSDFLFTLARWLNKQAGESEARWSVRP